MNAEPLEPVRSPVMLQSWNCITFLHWRCDPSLLRSRIPSDLEIDISDSSAWIGMTPFLLENLRSPKGPVLPWLSRFPEMNLRTYVVGPSGPGVWFFGLDAARLAAVVGGRWTFGLPYHWSRMSVRREASRISYRIARSKSGRADIAVEIGEPLEPADERALFLTARFHLYSIFRRRLASAPVEHRPWPLRHAELLRLDETIRREERVEFSHDRPMLLYSPGVDAKIGALKLF